MLRNAGSEKSFGRIRFSFLLVFWLAISQLCFSQEYFQQETNYKIAVKLDDSNHTLSGTISIEYKNNSNDTLDKLYIHLWPNAYSDKSTAFAQQQLKMGNTKFQFASSSDMGRISDLSFEIQEKGCNWALDPQNPDIVILILQKDLLPGEIINIFSPFTVKIPISFSRIGRSEGSYQLTQWYPKPAVYDHKGWHPMSYLAMGEFYAEFGNFEATIEAPNQYIIAATGFLKKVVENKETKIWHFTAENVHDFAWFADQNFIVDERLLEFENGKQVKIYAYYSRIQEELWKDAAFYAERALEFFSENIGEYPYAAFSVVQNPYMASGGMEYPGITIIDKVKDAWELDHVIAHEVGHMWFYGILASNERAYPWMDEGLTSFYDRKYIHKFYEDDHISAFIPNLLRHKQDLDAYQISNLTQAYRHYDQAMSLSSEKLSPINYILNSYVKPNIAFRHLEDYLGEDELNALFRGYYEKWKFKHPYPEDLSNYFTENSTKNIDWFFDFFTGDQKTMDISIERLEKQDNFLKIHLKHRGNASQVIKLSARNKNETKFTQWIEVFTGEKQIHIPAGDFDEIILDEDGTSFDRNRKNNTLRTSGWLKKVERPDYQFLGGLDNNKGSRRYLSPLLAFNVYDGLMIGGTDYGSFIPPKFYEDVFAGFYSFRSKTFSGIWNLRFNHFINKDAPAHLHFDIDMQKFGYAKSANFDYTLFYNKIQPSINYSFKSSFLSNKSHTFSYRSHLIWAEVPIFNEPDFDFGGKEKKFSSLHQLEYSLNSSHILYPYELKIGLEFERYENAIQEKHHYLRLNLDYELGFMFQSDKLFKVRLFGSTFLSNTQRDIGSTSPSLVKGTIPFSCQGFTDTYFEDFFFGRTEQDGIWSQQIFLKDGGFKNAVSSAFPNLGQSNSWLIAANLKLDLPFSLPINLPVKFYTDFAIYNAKATSSGPFESKLLYSGGLALEFENGLFGIYFPLFNASDINTAYNTLSESYSRRISFSFDISRFNGWKILDDVGR